MGREYIGAGAPTRAPGHKPKGRSTPLVINFPFYSGPSLHG
jgi:hypothetical protein